MKSVLQEARLKKLHHLSLEICAYRLAMFQNNANEMERAVDWPTGRSGEEDAMLNVESNRQASLGRLEKAREFTRRAIDSERRDGLMEVAAWHSGVQCVTRSGDRQRARGAAARRATQNPAGLRSRR